MTTRSIHLGPLTLPLELITLRTAFYGASGAGKTTTARLMAEQVHAAGLRFAAIDLKNDWYGLKSSADGAEAGIPAVIFGGPRKDVQLFEDAGAAVADAIAGIDQSVILDLDELSKGKQLRFLARFLERLYDVNRQPLLLICDEADRYASQKPMSPEAIVALGASEDIARRARKRGIGSLWLTQRTAVLNKNVSDLCDLTVVFRTPGARDLDELEDRVGRLATKEQVREVMKLAPGLEDGEAIFLSTHPKLREYLPGTVRPVQMPLPSTFDSSATPGVRGRRSEPKVLATADLTAIERSMAETIERVKADDPRELRKRIADLEGRLKMASSDKPKPEVVEKPVVTDKQLAAVDASIAKLNKAIERAGEVIAGPANAVRAQLQTLEAAIKTVRQPTLPLQRTASATRPVAPTNGHRPPSGDDAVGLDGRDGAASRILRALAQFGPTLTTRRLAASAQVAQTKSTWRVAIALLKNAGQITGERETGYTITDAGRAAVGSFEPLPTGRELYVFWQRKLGDSGAARRIFDVLVANGGHWTRQALGEQAQIDTSASTFRVAIAKLKSNELIELVNGHYALSSDLRAQIGHSV